MSSEHIASLIASFTSRAVSLLLFLTIPCLEVIETIRYMHQPTITGAFLAFVFLPLLLVIGSLLVAAVFTNPWEETP